MGRFFCRDVGKHIWTQGLTLTPGLEASRRVCRQCFTSPQSAFCFFFSLSELAAFQPIHSWSKHLRTPCTNAVCQALAPVAVHAWLQRA